MIARPSVHPTADSPNHRFSEDGAVEYTWPRTLRRLRRLGSDGRNMMMIEITWPQNLDRKMIPRTESEVLTTYTVTNRSAVPAKSPPQAPPLATPMVDQIDHVRQQPP